MLARPSPAGRWVVVVLGLATAGASCSGDDPGDHTPPSTPTGLTATYLPEQWTFALSWNASTDDVRVAGYEVWRDGDARGRFVVAETTWTDLWWRMPGQAYSYRVQAFDPTGNRSPSAVLEVTAPFARRYAVYGVLDGWGHCPDGGCPLLGEAEGTATFAGAWGAYRVESVAPNRPCIDALEYSDGTFASLGGGSNYVPPGALLGPPDGACAVLGSCSLADNDITHCTGGFYLMFDAPAGSTSLKVHALTP